MPKKLLFNNITTENSDHYEETIIGYPIQLENEGLCEEHTSSILSIVGDGVGKAVEMEDGSIVYEITIYATNSPYVLGKGGRLNE